MELGDVFQRILRRHWGLIVVTVLIGLAVPSAMHAVERDRYEATARLAIDASDPKSPQESAALADAAQGIVTSPGRVASALRNAHATRDADDFARKHVAVDVVGTSGVVDLSVSDKNPVVATAVANDLARQLIEARQQVAGGELPQLVQITSARIAALTDRISEQEEAIAAASATSNAREAQAQVLGQQHDAAVRARSGLEAQRIALIRQNPQGQLATRVAALDAQINAADQHIAELEAASAAVADPLSSPADVLRLQHDQAVKERGDLQSQLQRLVEADALRPNATIIDPARRPTSPVTSDLAARLVLGGLLGLALGITLAAVSEVVRPSVVGAEALARELRVPLLGRLPAPPSEAQPIDHERLAGHLVLAAGAANVGSVRLVSAGPPVDLEGMVGWFRTAAGLHRHELALAAAQPLERTASLPAWGMPLIFGGTNGGSTSTGLVLVAPSTLGLRELDPLSHLVALSGWRLLGVVTYEQSRFGRRRRSVKTTKPAMVVADGARKEAIRTT